MQPRGQQVNIWALPADVRQRLFDEEQRRKATQGQNFTPAAPEQLAQAQQQKPKLNLAQKTLPTVTSILGGILGGVVGNVPGAIAGGAAGGALGKGIVELTDQNKGVNAGAIATEAAFGAGGEALGPIAKVILGKPAAAVARKAGGGVMEKFAANILQASPSKTRQIAEEVGDPQMILQKWLPKIGGPKEATGGLKSFKGNLLTPLKRELADREDVIAGAVKQAGKNGIRFSSDDFIAALQVKRADLARLPTNVARVKELDKIIEQTQKLYKNGLSAEDLLKMKRVADAKWGKAVVETEKGAISTQVEREFANIARSKLKRAFGDVGKALDEESELLALEGLYRDSVAKGASKGFGEASINPLTWINKAVNSGAAGRAAYGDKPRATAVAGRVVGGVLKQSAPRLYGSLMKNSMEAQDEQEQVLGDTMNRIDQELSQAITQSEQLANNPPTDQTVDIGTGQALTKDQIQNMATIDLLYNGGKNLSELQSYQKLIEEETAVQKKSVTQAQRETLGSSGLRALDQLEVLLNNDPSLVTKQLIPGRFFSRNYDAAGFRIADAILRLRTGAAAPDREIKRYMQQIIPRFGDDEETIKFKLEQARADLEEALYAQQGVVGDQDLLQGLLNQ